MMRDHGVEIEQVATGLRFLWIMSARLDKRDMENTKNKILNTANIKFWIEIKNLNVLPCH